MATFRLLSLLLIFCWAGSISAVKRQDFKTCAQSGFCRRTRDLADKAEENGVEWKSPYIVKDGSIAAGVYRANMRTLAFPHVSFKFEVRFHKEGTSRVIADEVDGLRQRYNEAASWALAREPDLDFEVESSAIINSSHSIIDYFSNKHRLVIQHQPLLLTFYRDGSPQIVLNDRGLFNMEHFRLKKDDLTIQDDHNAIPSSDSKSFPHFPVDDVDGMWEENFGGHKDTKPKGPEALSMDISFPGYEYVYGLPQHAGPLSLRTTRGSGNDSYTDPYRLHNSDIFEYLPDSEMATYGAIPFMNAHRSGSSVAVLWLSGSETWIDITKPVNKRNKTRSSGRTTGITTSTHWMSESGILDLFVFLGPNPQDIQFQHGNLVGTTAMPQYFGIGNHQSRWNYQSQEDVAQVSRNFDEADIPLDVIWLDIEYAKEHEYFIWDERYFPDPLSMQKDLADSGRQLVAIIDPHIKRDENLYVYTEAKKLDILSKTREDKEYEGWCWTGSSAWVDFFNPKSWDWWINLFSFKKFKGSSRNLWIWNDMNEPAIFNGPEITMPKDNHHYGGWEHRDIHNINAIVFHNLTAQALINRETPSRRPFVLSRGFYIGTQRFGPTWQGDNLGTWEHLAASVKMTLSNSIAGMAWTGADVGGFFGNPSETMLVRWYQTGAFYPFFRAHAHIDTKRREPYLVAEPARGIIRDAIRLRYSLLPVWYTAFWQSHTLGLPIARPQYLVHPQDDEGFSIDDQFYVGDSGLLVKPITTEDATEASIYLADQEVYYNYFNHELYRSPSSNKGGHVKIPVSLETIPLLQQGGSILARRDLIRRSAVLMLPDPVSLVIALNSKGNFAKGSLYLDDGDTFAYRHGEYIWRNFELGEESDSTSRLVLSNRDIINHKSSGLEDPLNDQWTNRQFVFPDPIVSNASVQPQGGKSSLGKVSEVSVQDITVLGLSKEPTCVHLADSNENLGWSWSPGLSSSTKVKQIGHGKGSASILSIANTKLLVDRDWNIIIEFSNDKKCFSVTDETIAKQNLESEECPTGHFQCKNEGHISSCILLSRVNDGLCEPECCDGSDEFDGRVTCANTCKEINAKYQKDQAVIAEHTRLGLEKRRQYIQDGQKKKAELEKNVENLESGLKRAEENEKTLKGILERVEAQDSQQIELKKSTQLYQTLVKYQESIKNLRLERSTLDDKIESLSNILGELKEGYNPNYQDMAVLGAVRNFDKWVEDNSDEDNDSSNEINYLSDTDLTSLESIDVLELMDAIDLPDDREAALFKIKDYIPPQLHAHYDNLFNHVTTFLAKVGIIHPSQLRKDSNQSESKDLTNARNNHKSAEQELKTARTKLENVQSALTRDWGKEWEFNSLEGVCVKKPFGEYTYELCLFGEGKQIDSNGRSTSLGRFDSWNEVTEQGSAEYYSKQLYARGQSCWNGPQRSIKVDLICDSENALLSISEPEKCEYHFKVSTPALCNETA